MTRRICRYSWIPGPLSHDGIAMKTYVTLLSKWFYENSVSIFLLQVFSTSAPINTRWNQICRVCASLVSSADTEIHLKIVQWLFHWLVWYRILSCVPTSFEKSPFLTFLLIFMIIFVACIQVRAGFLFDVEKFPRFGRRQVQAYQAFQESVTSNILWTSKVAF